MQADACEDMKLLIQAELDGELDATRAMALAGHLTDCPGCTAERARQAALSSRLRAELRTFTAPDSLREKVERQLANAHPSVPVAQPHAVRTVPDHVRHPLASIWRWWQGLLAFGGGAAVTAAVLLLLVLPRAPDLTESVISDHIRALQPGHTMDVVSTNQHTVKPWFDGRLDFSPPVKDLAAQGFPLQGGRLDYLAGREVAALIYGRAKHEIDLYVWPVSGRAAQGPAQGEHNGYNFIRWTQDGMQFWAVSDVEANQLKEFVRLWQQAS
jgi:anti-sigma factor RsiW